MLGAIIVLSIILLIIMVVINYDDEEIPFYPEIKEEGDYYYEEGEEYTLYEPHPSDFENSLNSSNFHSGMEYDSNYSPNIGSSLIYDDRDN